ncbi:MAG TPA: hypothetical protein VK167_01700 [Flavipsychrobacter sp.]|nr:hypothetical protein [Flavipsychrobacter sp.]
MVLKNRTKISAAYNSLITELKRLEKFDLDNQKKFLSKKLTKPQIELLVESIFFSAFRAYEGFIREIFLLYCMEKQSPTKKKVVSYLKAKDFKHTESLIKSSMSFLDWTSPDVVIERAELYLLEGYPIKLPYSANLIPLRTYKKIRNHIAHNSVESQADFIKVVKAYNNTIPLKIPSPGEYLMLSSKQNKNNYLLLDFFDLLKKLASDLT